MKGRDPQGAGLKVGLALGGGGSRGFAHLGVVKALRELGVRIDCIAGTSIGSIVGAAVAADMTQRALNWTREPDWLKLPGLFQKMHMPKRSILGTGKIEKFFRDIICAKTFDELTLPFAAVATDLFTSEQIVMRSGSVQSAIRASMAIPGIFEPVERDGRILVDGGLSNPVPVDVCRGMGADVVIAVDINAKSSSAQRPGLSGLNIVSIVDMSFTVVSNTVAARVLRENPPDILLQPPVSDAIMMDFRRGERLVEAGYACAMENREALEGLARRCVCGAKGADGGERRS